ncbi:MAG: M28 family peptidase, partial [Polymorphobacter sp.]
LNPAALPKLLAASGRSAPALLADAVAARPLPGFDLNAKLIARFKVTQRNLTSDNVVALLPGSDPALAAQTVVVSAHIDGYGSGEPVNGDAIYNGAFDDAAYVATLIRLAQARAGRGFRRSMIFAAFTGEEKGLLGSKYFVRNPPVPRANIVANINLDAIRPLFPLRILTVIGLADSNLGGVITAVAQPMGVAVRADLEPERNMIERTDASEFLKAGIPAVSFMFGYDPGSASEAIFRNWYRTRYHKPQDDITQPIDFVAAADFNRFFYALAAKVADADQPPVLTPAKP